MCFAWLSPPPPHSVIYCTHLGLFRLGITFNKDSDDDDDKVMVMMMMMVIMIMIIVIVASAASTVSVAAWGRCVS